MHWTPSLCERRLTRLLIWRSAQPTLSLKKRRRIGTMSGDRENEALANFREANVTLYNRQPMKI